MWDPFFVRILNFKLILLVSLFILFLRFKNNVFLIFISHLHPHCFRVFLFVYLLCLSCNPLSVHRKIAKAGEPNNLLPMSPGMLSTIDPTVYANLRRKQRRLARENPGVLVAVSKGANQAILECQFQFRNRRWNCSTKNFLRGKNLFGKIVDRGKCPSYAFTTS